MSLLSFYRRRGDRGPRGRIGIIFLEGGSAHVFRKELDSNKFHVCGHRVSVTTTRGSWKSVAGDQSQGDGDSAQGRAGTQGRKNKTRVRLGSQLAAWPGTHHGREAELTSRSRRLRRPPPTHCMILSFCVQKVHLRIHTCDKWKVPCMPCTPTYYDSRGGN